MIHNASFEMALGNSTQGRSLAEFWNSGGFCNPKEIVSSSPGLRGTSCPGLPPVARSTPTGLCRLPTGAPQPSWGCLTSPMFPRAARSSQPWALSRNPFGIHVGNFWKELRL